MIDVKADEIDSVFKNMRELPVSEQVELIQETLERLPEN